MTHHTVSEAIAWLCSRDKTAMVEAQQAEPKLSVSVTCRRFRRSKTTKRERLLEHEPLNPSSEEALTFLRRVVALGMLPAVGLNAISGKLQLIPVSDLLSLRLQMCNDDRWSCGYWSDQEQRYIWLEPQFEFADIEALRPQIEIPNTQRTTGRMLERILEASINGPIKKAAALELVISMPDFSRSRFEEAWKKVPLDRKFGRGKRGPARHRP